MVLPCGSDEVGKYGDVSRKQCAEDEFEGEDELLKSSSVWGGDKGGDSGSECSLILVDIGPLPEAVPRSTVGTAEAGAPRGTRSCVVVPTLPVGILVIALPIGVFAAAVLSIRIFVVAISIRVLLNVRAPAPVVGVLLHSGVIPRLVPIIPGVVVGRGLVIVVTETATVIGGRRRQFATRGELVAIGARLLLVLRLVTTRELAPVQATLDADSEGVWDLCWEFHVHKGWEVKLDSEERYPPIWRS